MPGAPQLSGIPGLMRGLRAPEAIGGRRRRMEKRWTRSADCRGAGEEGCVWSRCALRAESARLLAAARRRQSRVRGLTAFL